MRASLVALIACASVACGDDVGDDPTPALDAGLDASSHSRVDAMAFEASAPGCVPIQRYRWSTQGGLVAWHNSYAVAPPSTLTVTREVYNRGTEATCSLELPTCGDPRIDLGELNAALTAPEIEAEFTDDPQVIGFDSRPVDGTVLLVEREDGKQLILGSGAQCDAGIADQRCSPAITPAVAQLRTTLFRIGMLAEQSSDCQRVLYEDGLSAGPTVDPGRPAFEYGPKADAHLFLDDEEVGYVFFTALAANHRAHLFADPALGSVHVDDYYVSLVFDDQPWKVGSYDGARAGRVRFVLDDGRSYASYAPNLDVELTITEGGPGEHGEYYMRASLQMTVASTELGRAPLRVEMRINSP
jgi:hypothetical protein